MNLCIFSMLIVSSLLYLLLNTMGIRTEVRLISHQQHKHVLASEKYCWIESVHTDMLWKVLWEEQGCISWRPPPVLYKPTCCSIWYNCSLICWTVSSSNTFAFEITLCLCSRWKRADGLKFAYHYSSMFTGLEACVSVHPTLPPPSWLKCVFDPLLLKVIHKLMTQNDVTLWV